MRPQSPKEIDQLTLESIERYFVEGEKALDDPGVAKTVFANATLVAHLHKVIVVFRGNNRSESTEISLANALQQLESIRESEFRRVRSRPFNTTRYIWPALIAVILGVGYVATGRDPGSQNNAVTENISYTSLNGQRTRVVLPDGSQVLLNVASRLEIPPDFGEMHRTVHLQGEALFTVSHLTGHPFNVMTGGTSTRVLGTTFSVRRYHTDTLTTVAVRDGKVAVQSVVIPANWQASISQAGQVNLKPAEPSSFDFASGALTLHNVSLPDAIIELYRWYDVDIRLASPDLAEKRVSANLKGSSIENLIAILEFTLNVRVERIGRTLTLYPSGV